MSKGNLWRAETDSKLGYLIPRKNESPHIGDKAGSVAFSHLPGERITVNLIEKVSPDEQNHQRGEARNPVNPLNERGRKLGISSVRFRVPFKGKASK